MKKLIVTAILGVFMSTAYVSVNPVSTNPILYENAYAQIEVAQHPLSNRAVDISCNKSRTCLQLTNSTFSSLWEARDLAERYLEVAGYEHRLCYAKWEPTLPVTFQVTTYSILPERIDNKIFRKIYSIFQQGKVLFRTFFPPAHLSAAALRQEHAFWSTLGPQDQYDQTDIQTTGHGPLTSQEVINKQMVFPQHMSDPNEILVLYNYAPLRTGSEQMHFLLIPNPANPAKNFLELNQQQYINVLSLVKKVTLWAEETFEGQATVHFFDKTGEIAGQMQPVFHAHLIIVKKGQEEIWGRLAMLFRMFLPPTPLPPLELAKRVNHYRETLGSFLERC